MKDKKKEQLLEYLRAKGFRYSLLIGSEEEFTDFVLEKGELLFLEDIGCLVVGDGKNSVVLCQRIFVRKKMLVTDPIKEQVREIYRRLKENMGIGQVKEFLYPPSFLEEFIKQKPLNFSFLGVDQKFPERSPLSKEWSEIPEKKGVFHKIVKAGDPLGVYQEDQVGTHSHKVDMKKSSIIDVLKTWYRWPHWFKSNDILNLSWAHAMKYNPEDSRYHSIEETRGHTITMLRLMRVY